jgi:hypothetical protein
MLSLDGLRKLAARRHDHGLPRSVHSDLPRSATSDSWRSLRSARAPPMDYRDKPPSTETGSRFNRRNRAKRVRIQPALTMHYLSRTDAMIRASLRQSEPPASRYCSPAIPA